MVPEVQQPLTRTVKRGSRSLKLVYCNCCCQGYQLNLRVQAQPMEAMIFLVCNRNAVHLSQMLKIKKNSLIGLKKPSYRFIKFKPVERFEVVTNENLQKRFKVIRKTTHRPNLVGGQPKGRLVSKEAAERGRGSNRPVDVGGDAQRYSAGTLKILLTPFENKF